MAGDPSELSKKPQTYEAVVKEIRAIQELIRRYQRGDVSAMGPYSYPAALERLRYLRVRQTQLKKKST